MAEIRPLREVDEQLLERLITGYSSNEVFRIVRDEMADLIRFELRLTPLEQPFVKRYPSREPPEMRRYQELATSGHCFGAFDGEMCIGLALCEPQQWNRSLVVHEFHIAPAGHYQGIGRALMATVEAHAQDQGMRCIVCETQTTNVPAIRFYRALGFSVDGIDVSLYSNEDIKRSEVAVFMKKQVAQPPTGEESILHLDE